MLVCNYNIKLLNAHGLKRIYKNHLDYFRSVESTLGQAEDSPQSISLISMSMWSFSQHGICISYTELWRKNL